MTLLLSSLCNHCILSHWNQRTIARLEYWQTQVSGHQWRMKYDYNLWLHLIVVVVVVLAAGRPAAMQLAAAGASSNRQQPKELSNSLVDGWYYYGKQNGHAMYVQYCEGKKKERKASSTQLPVATTTCAKMLICEVRIDQMD